MLNANIARSGVLSVHELSRFATGRIWIITYSGAFAVYFRPYRGAFDSLSAPAPENLPSIRKKSQIPRGQPPGGWGGAGRSWNWLMHNEQNFGLEKNNNLISMHDCARIDMEC